MDNTRHEKADNLRHHVKLCERGIEQCATFDPNERSIKEDKYKYIPIPIAHLSEVSAVLVAAKKGYESEYEAL